MLVQVKLAIIALTTLLCTLPAAAQVVSAEGPFEAGGIDTVSTPPDTLVSTDIRVCKSRTGAFADQSQTFLVKLVNHTGEALRFSTIAFEITDATGGRWRPQPIETETLPPEGLVVPITLRSSEAGTYTAVADVAVLIPLEGVDGFTGDHGRLTLTAVSIDCDAEPLVEEEPQKPAEPTEPIADPPEEEVPTKPEPGEGAAPCSEVCLRFHVVQTIPFDLKRLDLEELPEGVAEGDLVSYWPLRAPTEDDINGWVAEVNGGLAALGILVTFVREAALADLPPEAPTMGEASPHESDDCIDVWIVPELKILERYGYTITKHQVGVTEVYEDHELRREIDGWTPIDRETRERRPRTEEEEARFAAWSALDLAPEVQGYVSRTGDRIILEFDIRRLFGGEEDGTGKALLHELGHAFGLGMGETTNDEGETVKIHADPNSGNAIDDHDRLMHAQHDRDGAMVMTDTEKSIFQLSVDFWLRQNGPTDCEE